MYQVNRPPLLLHGHLGPKGRDDRADGGDAVVARAVVVIARARALEEGGRVGDVGLELGRAREGRPHLAAEELRGARVVGAAERGREDPEVGVAGDVALGLDPVLDEREDLVQVAGLGVLARRVREEVVDVAVERLAEPPGRRELGEAPVERRGADRRRGELGSRASGL